MGYTYDFRLASFGGELTILPRLGLPFPTSWTFLPYGRVEKRGDGSEAGFGYPSASWTWRALTQDQLARLWRLFPSDTAASVQVQIRTYSGEQATGRLETVDYTAFMSRPVDGNGRALDEGARPDRAAYTDVTVRFFFLT